MKKINKILSFFILSFSTQMILPMQEKRIITLELDTSFFNALHFKTKKNCKISGDCNEQMKNFFVSKNNITSQEYENKFHEVFCYGLSNGLYDEKILDVIAKHIINITKSESALEEFFYGKTNRIPQESLQILKKIKKNLEDKNEQAEEIKRQCEQDYQNQLKIELIKKEQIYLTTLKEEKYRYFGFGILLSFGLFGIHHYFLQWPS